MGIRRFDRWEMTIFAPCCLRSSTIQLASNALTASRTSNSIRSISGATAKACGMTFNDRDFVDVGHVKTIYGYDPEGNVIEVQQCTPANGFTLEELPRRP